MLKKGCAHSFAHQVALIHNLCSGRSNSNVHFQGLQPVVVKWRRGGEWTNCLCRLCREGRPKGEDFLARWLTDGL
jgi:hypothetical protein